MSLLTAVKELIVLAKQAKTDKAAGKELLRRIKNLNETDLQIIQFRSMNLYREALAIYRECKKTNNPSDKLLDRIIALESVITS